MADAGTPDDGIDSALDTLRTGIAGIESAGGYGVVGPVTSSGDRGYGKYQVMGVNVGPWTKAALGASMTPQQFLADPDAQESVFDFKMRSLLSQGYSPQDAASMWFTGRPLAQGARLRDQLGTSGAAYAAAATRGIPNGGQPVAQTDWLAQAAGQPASAPAAASPDWLGVAAGQGNQPAATPAQPTDWLAQAAGASASPAAPTSGAAPAPAAAPALGKGRPDQVYDIGNGVTLRVPTGPIVNPPQDPTLVNPYDPVSTQASALMRAVGGYAKQQMSGVLPAIGQDFRSGASLLSAGVNAMRNGSPLSGALASGVGALGMATSPLTGTTRQLVEQPVTDATGNPDLGSEAGLLTNMAGDSLLGRGVSALSSGLVGASIGTLDPETAQLAQIARDKFGIPVNAGQMSPSPGIRFASSALNRLPLSGADADIATQQTAFNRAVAGTIGESAGKLTPDVMNAARTRIGGYYDQVAKNTDLNVDPQFLQDIHDTLNNASMVLTKDAASPLLRQAQNILSKVDPNTKTISGDAYQALTNMGAPLDRLIDSSDPTVGYYANSLKKALDGALQRSATPENAALLKTADQQWWALKTIQPLVAKAPTGDISPALLAGRVNANTGNAMAFGGGGDLGTLARIGQRFLKEPPSSGTSERVSTLAALAKVGQVGSAALGAGALGVNAGISPAEMALTAGSVPTSLLAGRVLGSTLRSNWLAHRLIQRSLGNAAPPSLAPWAAAGALGDVSSSNSQ